jgi:hypothetical protein
MLRESTKRTGRVTDFGQPDRRSAHQLGQATDRQTKQAPAIGPYKRLAGHRHLVPCLSIYALGLSASLTISPCTLRAHIRRRLRPRRRVSRSVHPAAGVNLWVHQHPQILVHSDATWQGTPHALGFSDKRNAHARCRQCHLARDSTFKQSMTSSKAKHKDKICGLADTQPNSLTPRSRTRMHWSSTAPQAHHCSLLK